MIKKILIMTVSLLYLYSCEVLNELSDYSPSNSSIEVSEINTEGFTLSWEATVYDDGSEGAFFYEVFLIEGERLGVEDYVETNRVSSGWDLLDYEATGLNPGITYSYIVGVSDTEDGSTVFYDLGSTNTVTYGFLGQWQLGSIDKDSGLSTHYVYTFSLDSYTEDYYIDEHLFQTLNGSIDILSDTEFNIDVGDESSYTLWGKDGDNLFISGDKGVMTLTPYSGVLTPVTSLEPIYPDITSDDYESDNTLQEALDNNRTLIVGESQYHTIHVNGDVDWMMFNANAGSMYTIKTLYASTIYVDTNIKLYDTDGITKLAEDDDSGPYWYSKISYSFNSTGTYFIEVTDCNYDLDYNIIVEEVVSNGNGGIDLVIQ